MRAPLLLILLAAPLSAELLETEIAFQGTGCVSCAESLEPRLARVRGVDKVELDLDASTVRLVLEPGNKARIGPLRLRVTQDGTKILSMSAILAATAAKEGGAWAVTVTGPNETLALAPRSDLRLQDGQSYRFSGRILEDESGELMLEAVSAEPTR
jgi:copper chaperone CopZ